MGLSLKATVTHVPGALAPAAGLLHSPGRLALRGRSPAGLKENPLEVSAPSKSYVEGRGENETGRT